MNGNELGYYAMKLLDNIRPGTRERRSRMRGGRKEMKETGGEMDDEDRGGGERFMWR